MKKTILFTLSLNILTPQIKSMQMETMKEQKGHYTIPKHMIYAVLVASNDEQPQQKKTVVAWGNIEQIKEALSNFEQAGKKALDLFPKTTVARPLIIIHQQFYTGTATVPSTLMFATQTTEFTTHSFNSDQTNLQIQCTKNGPQCFLDDREIHL